MIIFIDDAIRVKFEKKKLIKIFIYTVIIILISFYLNMKYTVRVDYDDINKFGLCTDECVYIDLTTSEKRELLDEINTYNFKYEKNHMTGDITVLINDEIIQYRFIDLSEFRDDDLHYFVLRDEGKYYSFEVQESNNLLNIINKYRSKYKDILD